MTDVIVVGGGAAGLFCAFQAGLRGRRVLLIEHNDRVGKKIGISGGGRCNFTNLGATWENYLSANPDFCRSALARFTPEDFVRFVEKHGIAYHEKKLGQQFCDGSSRAIIEMLLAECAAAGVEIRCGCTVREVRKADRFVLETSQGEFSAESLVIATGGLSFAKLGATDFGYRVARQFGLKVTELRPGLVPLTLGGFADLSGVSLPVVMGCGGVSFAEAMLFTHRGVSGPAVLQISSYWREGREITVDLLPELKDFERKGAVSALLQAWPRRFADAWSERHALAKPLAHYTRGELEDLDRLLHRWPLAANGTEGYAKAEVTLGGVDTGGLSSKTMEARAERGLFFIGEVVDVTGWLGGYNFQWAWASAHAAAQVV